MGSGGPKQVQSVGFRFGQGLFVAEYDACRVILDFSERYETLAFKLQAIT